MQSPARCVRGTTAFVLVGVLLVMSACAVRQRAALSRGEAAPPAPPSALHPDVDRSWLAGIEGAAGSSLVARASTGIASLGASSDNEPESIEVLREYEWISAGEGALRRVEGVEWDVEFSPEGEAQVVASMETREAGDPVRYRFAWLAAGASLDTLDATPPRLLGRSLGIIGYSGWLRTQTLLIDPVVDEEPKGIFVFMPPLTSFPYDRAVRDKFRERGWRVVSTATFSYSGDSIVVDVDEQTTPDQAGAFVAEKVDGRLLQKALEVEAAIEFMRRGDPRLVDKPVVLGGFSAGAIGASTVVARNVDGFDAIILVGGASHVMETSRRSTIARNIRFEMTQGVELDDAFHIAAEAAYLDASELDPHHTAPSLTRIPTLVLHGAWDEWVPADRGVALWERLGKPERMVFSGGHQILFWRLPSIAGQLEAWASRVSSAP